MVNLKQRKKSGCAGGRPCFIEELERQVTAPSAGDFGGTLALLALSNCDAVSIYLPATKDFWWRECVGSVLGCASPARFSELDLRDWLSKIYSADRQRVKRLVAEHDAKMVWKKGAVQTGCFRMRGDGQTIKVKFRRALIVSGAEVAVLALYTGVPMPTETDETSYVEQLETALRRELRKRSAAERVARKQSQALAHTFDLLVQKPELIHFVRGVLRVIVRECNAMWATFWQADRHSDMGGRWTAFHADPDTEREVERFASAHQEEMKQLAVLYERLLKRDECVLTVPYDDRRVPLAVKAFYQKIGAQCVILAPMIRKGKLKGWMSFVSRIDTWQIGPDKVALMEAMARQALLALHLNDLNDLARKADLERERTRLAKEREEESNQISTLLRLPAVSNAENSESADGLLKAILQSMAVMVKASAAMLWHREGHGESLPMLAWDKGHVYQIVSSRAETLSELFRTKHSQLLAAWWQAKEMSSDHMRSPRMKRLLADLGRHEAEGVDRYLLTVPLILNEHSYGFVLMIVSEPCEKSGNRGLALNALALQAALVLRLHDLSVQQRSAALARERSRIARDMHDLLVQSFSGISLQIEAMQADRLQLPASVFQRLQKIQGQAARSGEDLRRSVEMLRPALLDMETLPGALMLLGQEVESIYGVPIRVDVVDHFPTLDSKKEIHLFAIASEALQNAARHSKAKLITLELRCRSGTMTLLIRDDGEGFSTMPTKTICRQSGAHSGLLNMRERAESIGAHFLIRSKKGYGTKIEVRF